MQKIFILSLCLFSFFNLTHKAAQAQLQGKVIYGEDNRKDVYAVDRQDFRNLADSTVALVPFEKFQKTKSGTYKLTSSTFGKDFNLCSNEPFFDQPSAASCSGFLVDDDLIATAGHCVTVMNCSNYKYVFNYRMADKNTPQMEFHEDDLYGCKEIVKREYTSNQDYAIVKLDRPVKGHKVLSLSNQSVQANDSILVIGHPSGLPTKITDNANVRSVKTGFFQANLDTYGGNSGSAVFNANTDEVEGILVRGARDFSLDYDKRCYHSNVCPNDGCNGEDVTLISYVVEAIKKYKNKK